MGIQPPFLPLTLGFFPVAMLSILSVICFYGATASLTNCMFGKDLLVTGPPLLTVRDAWLGCAASSLRGDIPGPSVQIPVEFRFRWIL